MPKRVNRKLRAARRAKGWSLKVAADKVGICPQTFYRWEYRQQVPQPGSIALLLETFGVEKPDDLGFSTY